MPVDLDEWVKDALEVCRSDPDARVTDPDAHRFRVTLARDVDLSALRRELDGVRDEIEQDLLQSLGICDNGNVG